MNSTASSPIDGFYSAFKAAHEAIEALPILQSERDKAKADAEAELNAHLVTVSQLEAAQTELATLKSDLAAKEAALNDATKSRDQMAGVLDIIRGAIPQPVVAEPVAVTEPVGQSENDPTIQNESTSSLSNTNGFGFQNHGSSPTDTSVVHDNDSYVNDLSPTSGHESEVKESTPESTVVHDFSDPTTDRPIAMPVTSAPSADSSHGGNVTDSSATSTEHVPSISNGTDHGISEADQTIVNAEPWRNWKPDGDRKYDSNF